MRLLVVIPALNEEKNIPPLLEEIFCLRKEYLDILIIDDHSDDRTFAWAREAASRDARVRVIRQPYAERGLANCYKAGFQYALKENYDWILGMDADHSHDPADIPRLLACQGGADWITGSRYCPGGRVEGMGFTRLLISRLANLYIRKRLRLRINDVTSGFNCFKKDVLERVDFLSCASKGFVFQVEMKYLAAREGFRFKEVPIVFHRRRFGASKFSPAMISEALLRIQAIAKKG